MSAASSACVGAAEGAGDAELRAGLVEGAVGLGAAVVLGDAAAVPERGRAVVALLGVDLDHGADPTRERPRRSADRVEDEAGQDLGEEVGRLRRHVLVGSRQIASHLLDRDRPQDEGDVVGAVRRAVPASPRRSSRSRARAWRGCRLRSGRRSPSGPASRGSPRRGGGRPPACRRAARSSSATAVLQPQPEGALVVGVVEAEDADPLLAARGRAPRRRPRSTSKSSRRPSPRRRWRSRVLGEAGEQAVGGEDGEAGSSSPVSAISV